MIRTAKIEDVLLINEIYNDAKQLLKNSGSTQWQDLDGYPNKETIINDIHNNELYVKVYNNTIVAVIMISFKEEVTYKEIYEGSWLNQEAYIVVHRLAVKKEYYNMGFAKELLIFAEGLAIKNNCNNIRIDTMENNIIMQDLLKKLNYQNCGIIYLNKLNVFDRKRIAFQKEIKRQ